MLGTHAPHPPTCSTLPPMPSAHSAAQMVEKEAAAERLRSEVGSLEAAKLTAEAMASRLEEMNEMSMRVGGWVDAWVGRRTRVHRQTNTRVAKCGMWVSAPGCGRQHWRQDAHAQLSLLDPWDVRRHPFLSSSGIRYGMQLLLRSLMGSNALLQPCTKWPLHWWSGERAAGQQRVSHASPPYPMLA